MRFDPQILSPMDCDVAQTSNHDVCATHRQSLAHGIGHWASGRGARYSTGSAKRSASGWGALKKDALALLGRDAEYPQGALRRRFYHWKNRE